MSAPVRLLINGAKGRMGQALVRCAVDDAELAVAAEVDVGDELSRAVEQCDVVIDFSHHTTIGHVLACCESARKPLVIGTTGHTDEEVALIKKTAAGLPVVFSANYSTGVNTLFWLTRKAAEILGPAFDLEIVEMHHRLKKDSPSGTAKRLAEILADVRALAYNDDVRHGRHGIVGERTNAEIGMHAVRGGDVVGDHTVIFAANGERVELTHRASSRDTFAQGALRAAKWVAARPNGLYDMQDVLGLR